MSEDTHALKPALVQVTCPCGTVFEVKAWRIAAGRGKFCSKPCKYKYQKLPSRKGMKYNVARENPTKFKPGHVTWNKGMKGIHFSPGTEFKPGERPSPATEFKPDDVSGEKNFRWAGGLGSRSQDQEGYTALHYQVRKERGRAADYPCTFADDTCKGATHWANISREYKGVDDFMPLCRSHHARYDGGLLIALLVYGRGRLSRVGPGPAPCGGRSRGSRPG